MPVYNGAQFLREAIESILTQELTDFEFLIINDGSTDNSENIIRGYEDDRIRYFKNDENRGLVESLNRGIQLSQGKFIARMDADDISMPSRLFKQLHFMQQHPEVGAVGTWFKNLVNETVREGGRYQTSDTLIRLKHLYQINICHGSAMISTATLKEHNISYRNEYVHAEDYDLFDRLGQVSRLANLPEVLYLVRVHPHRISKRHAEAQMLNSFKVRRSILARMGLETDMNRLDVYTKLMHQDYDALRHQGEAVRALLKDLYFANLAVGMFDRVIFNEHLHRTWLHFNLNTVGKGTFNSGFFRSLPFSDHIRIDFKNLVKLILRPFTR